MSDETGTDAPSVPPPATRGWKRPAVLVTIVVLLVAGVPALARPDAAFSGDGLGYDIRLAPGEQVVVGLGTQRSDVHVTDARPIVSGGIGVRVSVRRCPLVGAALGSTPGREVARSCAVPPPADGLPAGAVSDPDLLDEAEGSLPAASDPPVEGDVQLVAVIEPLEAGTVTIEEIELTHSRGPFDRTERIAPQIRIEADPAYAQP